MELYCSFCIVIRKNDVKKAETVLNGHAVCGDHFYYAQGGEHARIVAIIRLDEEKKHPSCSETLVTGVKARSISAKVRRGKSG